MPDLTIAERTTGADVTLDTGGFRIAIDADCPDCGWPERYYDISTRRFGCIKCTYESDERNA